MYTALGHPEKAAKWIKAVTDSIYKTGPDGLSGNDDCGQMSAWYTWTSLGIYPMNPASGEYVFGYPLIKKATLQLPNNKTLQIRVNKINKPGKQGIASVYFNGLPIPVTSINHTQLLQGGNLVYTIY
jgi:putative alpha-1,2-mannosidase